MANAKGPWGTFSQLSGMDITDRISATWSTTSSTINKIAVGTVRVKHGIEQVNGTYVLLKRYSNDKDPTSKR